MKYINHIRSRSGWNSVQKRLASHITKIKIGAAVLFLLSSAMVHGDHGQAPLSSHDREALELFLQNPTTSSGYTLAMSGCEPISTEVCVAYSQDFATAESTPLQSTKVKDAINLSNDSSCRSSLETLIVSFAAQGSATASTAFTLCQLYMLNNL